MHARGVRAAEQPSVERKHDPRDREMLLIVPTCKTAIGWCYSAELQRFRSIWREVARYH
jgi:hypothetical protein